MPCGIIILQDMIHDHKYSIKKGAPNLCCAVMCSAVKDFHRFEHGSQAPFVFLCFLWLQHSITVIYIALQMMIHYGVIIALGIVSPFHDNMTYPSIRVNRVKKYNLDFV